MPELNLIEDDSSGGPSTTPSVAQRRRPPRGGGFAGVLVILLALVVVLVALYLANQYGILNLWGKKSAPETVQQQPTFPAEPFQEAPAPVETTAVAVEKPPPTAERLVEPKPQAKAPEKSTPAPAQGDVSKMSGTYTIQVSAWKDRATADDQSNRLVRAGLPAFVEELRAGGTSWYTVRVGKYSSPQAARSALGDMPREIQDQYWIDRVRAQ